MKFTDKEWIALSEWVDQGLELTGQQLEEWLDRLPESCPVSKSILRDLLSSSEVNAGTGRFLKPLPDVFQNTRNVEKDHGATLFAGRTVGPYRLIRELGQGGMGVVWLGERADGILKRSVAIKLPHAGVYGRHFIERFQREREILASLTHPHIGRLYDAGVTDEGEPFLALEYIEGTELISYCDSKQMGVRERLKLFLQVLSAVHHANSHLVIHRDLKPSNILVGIDGQVKLLDFGVAKLILDGEAHGTELTQRAGHALTPRYASPEQIAGEPISTASDVYSLGVVLFELLTGERPYRSKIDSRASLEEAILAGEIVSPTQAVQNLEKARTRGSNVKKLTATLKRDLDCIILKSLARQPEQRYATADAFSQDIQRYLNGQPVLAQAESVWYRFKKFAGRNRLAVAAVAAVVLALTVGLAAALWEGRKAREQAHVAESVLAFMEGIFRANSISQPDPVKARQTTARELLDIGANHLDNALNDVPAAKMRVLSTLNEMYDDLDLWDKEVELGRKRVALARSIYGRYDPAVADALLDLAESIANQDLHEEHGQVLQEIGLILDKQQDYTSQRRAKLEATLADFYNNVDFGQALSHTRTAVRLMRALPVSYERSNILQSSAYYELEAGDYARAEAVSAESIAIGKSIPDNEANLAWEYKHLADAQNGAEDLLSAGRNYAIAREYTRKYNNADGPWALGVALAYANFLVRTSRMTQGLAIAGPAFDTSLKLARQRIALIMLPDAAIDYGNALVDYGRIEEGFDVWKQAETVRGPLEAWNMLEMRQERADALIEMGRYAEAEALLTGAATGLLQMNRRHTLSYNRNLALRTHLLNVTGRKDEALNTLSEYQVFSIPPGRVARSKLEELILRSEIRLSAKDYKSAANLAAQAREAIEGSPNRPLLAICEARAALAEGRAILLLGEPRKALPLLDQAVNLRTGLLDRASPALADADIALSNCYLDLHERKKASVLLARAKAIHREHAILGEHYRKPMTELERRMRAQVYN